MANNGSLSDIIIGNLQEGLTGLTEALHELTLTISANKGDVDKTLATLNLEIKYLRTDIDT